MAKIVFQIVCGDGNHSAQFDEQFRLINANDAEEAFAKAQFIGSSEEEIFYRNDRQIVRWKFINVSELCKINALIDGVELYSRIEEREDGDNYLWMINEKAASIKSGNTLEILELV